MPPRMSRRTEYNIEQYIVMGEATKDICDMTCIGPERVNWMRRNLRDFGAVRAPHSKRGRPRKMTEEMEEALLVFLDANPDAYLYEMTFYLYDAFDEFEISEPALSVNLERLKMSRKKVSHFP